MYTSRNPLTVVRGGTETRLDTLAYNISTKGGVGASMAPLRGSSTIVPGRSGSLYRRGKKRDEATSILSMWAQDTDVDGATPVDPYLQWRSNMDKLLMLFDTSNERIELREYIQAIPLGASLAGKPYRRATVEVRSAIDPEVLGKTFGQFKVECVINETYWEDYVLQNWSSPVGAAAVGTHDMSLTFGGMTAPIEDALITVSGAGTNPKLTDPRSGHWIQLSEVLPNGSNWVIDCANWTSFVGAVNKTATTTFSGPFSPGQFGISANDGTPSIQFEATAPGANARVQVQARRKFH